MIKSVSTVNGSFLNFGNGTKKTESIEAFKERPIKPYVDSFVKNSKKSAPILAGITVLWALIDKSTKKIPLPKALINNFGLFFLPVLASSSLLLSLTENRKPINEKNN